MNQDERQHLTKLKGQYIKRFRVLELRAARQGIETDPGVITEMEEIGSKLQDIDLKLGISVNQVEQDITALSLGPQALPKGRVEIRLSMDLNDWTPEVQKTTIAALAATIEIPSIEINILKVHTGSIILLLEMPSKGIDTLITLYRNGDLFLEDIGIINIRREMGSLP